MGSPSTSGSYHNMINSPIREQFSSGSLHNSILSDGGASNSSGRLIEEEERRSEQFRKLFVGGLTPNVSDDLLKSFFIVFGEITDVVVMKDNKTGRSRGFGFVTFREPEMVDAAQDARPHILDGKEVETKRAMPREDSDKPEAHMTVKKLFVGALKKDVTSEDLRDYFSEFGNIEESEVMTWKETGESRGFGFVTFDDYDPVDKSILYKPHQIKSSRADVKKALSKEEMAKVKAKQEQHQHTVSFAPSAALQLASHAHIAANLAVAGPYPTHHHPSLGPMQYQFAGISQPPQQGPTYSTYPAYGHYQQSPMPAYTQGFGSGDGLPTYNMQSPNNGLRGFQGHIPRGGYPFPGTLGASAFGACTF